MKDGTNLYIFSQTNAYFLKNLHGGGIKYNYFMLFCRSDKRYHMIF